MTAKDKLLDLVKKLSAEGEPLKQRKVGGHMQFVSEQTFAKWLAGCRNLLRMLGPYADPWKHPFEKVGNRREDRNEMRGTLEAIREALENDLLITAEELIRAELFDDLLEQADYLLSKNYERAAAVLGRAVLEEHLRKWCDKANCTPVMQKPTQKPSLANYDQSLYKANVINKLVMKQIELMAVVGNDAAHNNPLKRDDVEKMLRDVREFIVKNPV